MDARAGKRERLAASVLAEAARLPDDERLVTDATFEHVNADARTPVVVEARVTRIPPRVQPGLRVVGAPQQLEGTLSLPVEGGEVDEQGCRSRECSALLGSEVPVGERQRFEAGNVDHGLILDNASSDVAG